MSFFDDIKIHLSAEQCAEPPLDMPEKGLLRAVLERALFDLFNSAPRHDRRQAEIWFADDAVLPPETGFSFGYVCEQLDLNPGMLRRLIAGRRQAEKRILEDQIAANAFTPPAEFVEEPERLAA